jgi:hypothetical protein
VSDDGASETRTEPKTETTSDPIFESLWGRVLEAWDDDKPHAAFLEHAIRTEQLHEAAGRYRPLKDDPERGARAKKKLDGIVLAAMHMLNAMKTPPRQKVPLSITLSAVLVCAILLGWLSYAILGHH